MDADFGATRPARAFKLLTILSILTACGSVVTPILALIEKLRKRNERLEKDLSLARKLIELQKKYHEVLGVALPSTEETEEP